MGNKVWRGWARWSHKFGRYLNTLNWGTTPYVTQRIPKPLPKYDAAVESESVRIVILPEVDYDALRAEVEALKKQVAEAQK